MHASPVEDRVCKCLPNRFVATKSINKKKKIEKPNNSEITPQNVMKHIQVYQVCQIPIKSGLPVLRLFLFNEIMCIIAKHTQLTRTSEKYKYPVSTKYK